MFTNLFILQIFSAFLVGGFVVGLLTFIVEKLPPALGGFIITIPSTLVVAYVFIALANSPETIVVIAPTTIATFGIALLFFVSYAFFSRISLKKVWSVLLSSVLALGVFFLLVSLLTVFQTQLTQLPLALLIYITCLVLTQWIMIRQQPGKKTYPKHIYTPLQKVGRSVFIGLIVALAVFLSRVLGLVWGGIFSAFPAAYYSTLLIFHWYYGSDYLFAVYRFGPLGSITLVIFVLITAYTYQVFGIAWGTVLALTASGVYSLAATMLHRYYNKLFCRSSQTKNA